MNLPGKAGRHGDGMKASCATYRITPAASRLSSVVAFTGRREVA